MDIDGSEPSCNPSDYAVPVVEPQQLPQVAPFDDAIDRATPANEFGTPTYPALAGTIEYARQLESEGKQAAIVIVTDGEPYSCDPEKVNNIENIAALAAEAAAEIPTYVIGVGNVEGLHQVAQGGGTESAFIVSLDDPAQTRDDLLSRIQKIRQAQVFCDVPLPEPEDGDVLDLGKVNVDLVLDGQSAELGRDADCVGEHGWRYDDAQAPSGIQLCPQVCDSIQRASDVTIDVILGCETKELVVR